MRSLRRSQRVDVGDESSRSGKGWLMAGGLVLSLFACGAVFTLWGLRPHETSGEVVATEWWRMVHQERFSPVTQQDWLSELSSQPSRMPTNGGGELAGMENIRNCFARERGTHQVQDGTQRVCITTTRQLPCRTQKHCFKTMGHKGMSREVCKDITHYCGQSSTACEDRPRYRPEPILAQWCTYDTHEWRTLRKQTAYGREEPPHWPEVSSPSPEDRLRLAERFVVTIEYRQDDRVRKHTLVPETEAEFLVWKKGQRVSVTFDDVGSVQAVVAH